MNIQWYLRRLRKMSPAEVGKRLIEEATIRWSRVRYSQAHRWAYDRFASGSALRAVKMYVPPLNTEWTAYRIYDQTFDLTQPIPWHFSEQPGREWPLKHYSRINYRPGNPVGDVRINWELNRLQFLPEMAVSQPDLAVYILRDWMQRNPYQHGPAYLSAMEVALRWISVYRCYCALPDSMQETLERSINGLAVASGKFIASRLSTHSSAGNHLIVEGLGLFWIAHALKHDVWKERARSILQSESIRQINPDGGSREMSFWYLGFVLDALFHWFFLEDLQSIPLGCYGRVHRTLVYLRELTQGGAGFPDLGDRDDGFVLRVGGTYSEDYFQGLLALGNHYFTGEDEPQSSRLAFWRIAGFGPWPVMRQPYGNKPLELSGPLGPTRLNGCVTFPSSGISILRNSSGEVLFRHGNLGLPPTYGHGHADALSVLLNWKGVPVLIDPGSGQYNGDQKWRNYFRSTIAHNTVEVGEQDQAKMLGPFLWDQSWKITEFERGHTYVQASHDGYEERFGAVHRRRVAWMDESTLQITDDIDRPVSEPLRIHGAFHFGPSCRDISVLDDEVTAVADFGGFKVHLHFGDYFNLLSGKGVDDPIRGWRNLIYGNKEPIETLIFGKTIEGSAAYQITLTFH